MKKEDIKKPNPNAIPAAAKIIVDLVNKIPSDDFFESIENTDPKDSNQQAEIPKVASNVLVDSIEIHH